MERREFRPFVFNAGPNDGVDDGNCISKANILRICIDLSAIVSISVNVCINARINAIIGTFVCVCVCIVVSVA